MKTGMIPKLIIWMALFAGVFSIYLIAFLKIQADKTDVMRCVFSAKGLAERTKWYNDTLTRLPHAAGNKQQGFPPYSWRLALLTDLGDDFANQYRFHENWNSVHNSNLNDGDRWIHYRCVVDTGPQKNTSYVAITGPNTPFPSSGSVRLPDLQAAGAQNTILYAEMHNSGIHWTEPRDLSLEDASKGINLKSQPSISSQHTYFGGKKRDGAMAAFADGSVRWISASIDPKILRSLLEIKNPDKPTAAYNDW